MRAEHSTPPVGPARREGDGAARSIALPRSHRAEALARLQRVVDPHVLEALRQARSASDEHGAPGTAKTTPGHSATVVRLTAAEHAFRLREELRAAVVAAVGAEPCKVIAFLLGVTENGARKIQSGEHLPKLEHALMLAREYPHIFRCFIRSLAPELLEDGE